MFADMGVAVVFWSGAADLLECTAGDDWRTRYWGADWRGGAGAACRGGGGIRWGLSGEASAEFTGLRARATGVVIEVILAPDDTNGLPVCAGLKFKGCCGAAVAGPRMKGLVTTGEMNCLLGYVGALMTTDGGGWADEDCCWGGCDNEVMSARRAMPIFCEVCCPWGGTAADGTRGRLANGLRTAEVRWVGVVSKPNGLVRLGRDIKRMGCEALWGVNWEGMAFMGCTGKERCGGLVST